MSKMYPPEVSAAGRELRPIFAALVHDEVPAETAGFVIGTLYDKHKEHAVTAWELFGHPVFPVEQ